MTRRLRDDNARGVDQPLAWLALAWAGGLWLGSLAGSVLIWVSMGVVPVCLVLAWWAGARAGRLSAAMLPLVVGVAAMGVGWSGWRGGDRTVPDLARYVQTESRLVNLTGRVVSEPRVRFSDDTGMASFMFSPPGTRCFVAVDTLHTPDGDRPTDGGVLLSIPQADTRLRVGDQVRVTGWLSAIPPPTNPGERDFGAAMAKLGVVGKLHCKSRGNVQLVELAQGGSLPLVRWHMALQDQVAQSLQAGIDEQAGVEAVALLDAMLLGRRSDGLEEVSVVFRRTGLAHLLAISGLHVGVLAAGVWLLLQIVLGRPRAATMAALLIVALYLAVVPWRVPVMRAGFMTVAVLLGLTWHRRISGLSLMSLIAIVLLAWRPSDLFDAGFQLSFGIVTALLLWAGRVARALVPASNPMDEISWATRVLRWLGNYLAVSVVAWLMALPIVVFHFNLVSPLAVLLGIVMFPLMAVVLWVGFVKIAIGLLLPGVGAMLAGLLVGLAALMYACVRLAAELPGAWFTVPQPSAAWALASVAVIVALLAGWFAGRRVAMVACVLLCSGWLYAQPITQWITPEHHRPALTIDMIAVGNGSCFLLRSDDAAMLFDCGSSNYAQIGRYTIVPALQALGVDHLDMIVVSHADYDHFSGTLDVVDHLPVKRIVTTAHVLDEASAHPTKATGYLIDQLRKRDVRIDAMAAGERFDFGHAQVSVIWPPVGQTFERSNDSSLVFAFEAGGRRALMCGDIQTDAMNQMIEQQMNLRADVTDLPHHGSFPPPAPAWLARVEPSVVLQSSSWQRLRWDKWADHLEGITRLVSSRDGASHVKIGKDGRIEATPFVKPATRR